MELRVWDTGHRDFYSFTEELNFYYGVQKEVWKQYPNLECIVRDDKRHTTGSGIMELAIWFQNRYRPAESEEFAQLTIIGIDICEFFTAMNFEVTE